MKQHREHSRITPAPERGVLGELAQEPASLTGAPSDPKGQPLVETPWCHRRFGDGPVRSDMGG